MIVDCADLGLEPGAWRLFDEAALNAYNGSSTHGLGLADALALVRRLGFDAPLHCFGIQPADLADRDTLSGQLEAALPRLDQTLRDTIELLRDRRAA